MIRRKCGGRSRSGPHRKTGSARSGVRGRNCPEQGLTLEPRSFEASQVFSDHKVPSHHSRLSAKWGFLSFPEEVPKCGCKLDVSCAGKGPRSSGSFFLGDSAPPTPERGGERALGLESRERRADLPGACRAAPPSWERKTEVGGGTGSWRTEC